MSRRALLWCLLAVAGFSGNAQTIQKAPVRYTSPTSGAAMFKEYCAVCHGVDGKGNGPAAAALKTAPAHLAGLTQRNGGKFPEAKVAATIKGDAGVPAHGSRDMPIWGSSFLASVSHESPADVQLRIANLTAYLQTLQGK